MAKRWYIVHAYSNFEKKVADSIREKAAAAGLDHLIGPQFSPLGLNGRLQFQLDQHLAARQPRSGA